jgi:uncharacterized protein
MRAKVFFITLAVDDLGRSLAFYRDGLGWPTQGVVGQEFHDELTGADGTIAIFILDDGLTLMLYERANLAKDASLPAGPPSSTEFSLGIPAESREEVDRLLTQAQAADGTVTAPAHMRPFGVYSGYFTTSTGTSSRSPGTPASSAAYPPRAWPPQHRIPPGRPPDDLRCAVPTPGTGKPSADQNGGPGGPGFGCRAHAR